MLLIDTLVLDVPNVTVMTKDHESIAKLCSADTE